jgi:hypothetical protein
MGLGWRKGEGRSNATAAAAWLEEMEMRVDRQSCVANMALYAISSCLILVIHDNMINGTNLIV